MSTIFFDSVELLNIVSIVIAVLCVLVWLPMGRWGRGKVRQFAGNALMVSAVPMGFAWVVFSFVIVWQCWGLAAALAALFAFVGPVVLAAPVAALFTGHWWLLGLWTLIGVWVCVVVLLGRRWTSGRTPPVEALLNALPGLDHDEHWMGVGQPRG